MCDSVSVLQIKLLEFIKDNIILGSQILQKPH